MRPARPLALALCGLASACVGLNVGADEGCAEACAVALACGFLPSMLGWAVEDDDALADCERRCGNSPRGDEGVAQILTCLEGQDDYDDAPWCADAAEATWTTCARAQVCLDQRFGRHTLVGEATATVHVLSVSDYTRLTGASAADIYTARAARQDEDGDAGPITSCDRALCGHMRCDAMSSAGLCDDTLCHQDEPPPSRVCDALAATRVSVHAAQPSGEHASVIVFDAESDDAGDCSRLDAASFADEMSRLAPGPVEFSAQVRGVLPASVLKDLDHLDTGDKFIDAAEVHAADPDATMSYCLEFYGPTVLLRAGENEAVVPIGTVAEILDPASPLAPRFCPP